MLRLITNGLVACLRQPYLGLSRRLGRVVRPLFLHYAVTWRCNARCLMCDTWRRESPGQGKAAAGQLSVDELDAILARDQRMLGSLSKVGLTGGEPFLRPDIVDLVRCLHERLPRAHLSLVSNGLLTDTILARLEEIRAFLPVVGFSVSLDGLEGVHDQVRGVPGAFAKALATIQGALALGLRVTSGMTITPQNCHQIGEVAGLMERLGVDFSCNLTEQGANFHSTGPGPSLSPPQRAQVLAALQDFPHHYYMDNLARQMQGRDRTLPCYAGMSSYFLAPDGDLLLCNLLQTPLGNLRQDSWAQIAQSQKAWDMRRQALSCSCWSQCEVKNAAASAPWHIVCWWAGSPAKAATIRRLARTARHHLP